MKIYSNPNRNFVEGRGHTDSLDNVGLISIGTKVNEYKVSSGGADIPLHELKKISKEEITNAMIRKKSSNTKNYVIGDKALSLLIKRKGIYSETGIQELDQKVI